MLVIREGAGPYTVPVRKLLIVTALGNARSHTAAAGLIVNGIPDVFTGHASTADSGDCCWGSPTVYELPKGFIYGAGAVVAVESDGLGRACGYLIDVRDKRPTYPLPRGTGNLDRTGANLGPEEMPSGPPRRRRLGGTPFSDLGFAVHDDEYALADSSYKRRTSLVPVQDPDAFGGIRFKFDTPPGTPPQTVAAFQGLADQANRNPQLWFKALGWSTSGGEDTTAAENAKRGKAYFSNLGIYAPEEVGPQPLKAPVELTPADEEILKSMMKFPKWNLGEEEERKKREEEKSDAEAFREFMKEEGDG